ncbi:restriction endonuclease subunit S [Bacteroides caccae]|jgi:type I restriction enzyme S subunit|uniref:restriction endonuclease subunit S n=1 Tax=Bacteroides TaxID=816 RepID=UPI001C736744|nr:MULTISPECIES: restriction endonuclease subunit S [Bacteroides]MCA4528250.1 restriction endonuclease subunit S [Bacteroides ovatus]MCA4574621.1 restriction endonuclease subunit S [Bacteroides ovatus]MCS2368704.1 restriction endonuclease subunit S [Bacteroides caccae]MCS3193215.1 restriction endonuclease subunit S [Bacteroides caccae]
MSQFIEMFGNPVTNTKGWKTAKIKDVAPEMPSKEQLSGKIWLLNLDMIESNTGRIIEKVYEDVENALSVQSFDEGNVLFSKLRPYLNKVVIPDEPGMATTELVPLRPEPSKLHKVFLSHLLRGNQFVNYANDIAGGTKMPRMPLTELRNFDCILPPMDKQLEFVFIAEQVDKSKFGDFKSQFIEMFGNPLSLNQKNELKRLGECCILNPRRPNIALCDTDKVSFIPMPAVSEDGYLVDMTDEEYGKVKKSFTYFENNDVLFAKITPCMENGKGAIVHGLTNGIGMGSTEFHVLRPINGISSPYWLLALTRMPIFRERAAKNMSGTGGQKRVSASYLDHFMVGLPAIEEQRRFEAIYRQADKSKSVIQKALVYLNDIQSDELGKIA